MSSGDVLGVEVDGLNGAGRKVAGRSTGGQSAADGLKRDLDAASGSVGQGRIKSALASFVTNHIVENSNLVGHQLSAAGNNVSNVASTARSSDEENAHTLAAEVNLNTALSTDLRARINRIE